MRSSNEPRKPAQRTLPAQPSQLNNQLQSNNRSRTNLKQSSITPSNQHPDASGIKLNTVTPSRTPSWRHFPAKGSLYYHYCKPFTKQADKPNPLTSMMLLQKRSIFPNGSASSVAWLEKPERLTFGRDAYETHANTQPPMALSKITPTCVTEIYGS